MSIKILKTEKLTYRDGWDVTINKVSTDDKRYGELDIESYYGY